MTLMGFFFGLFLIFMGIAQEGTSYIGPSSPFSIFHPS